MSIYTSPETLVASQKQGHTQQEHNHQGPLVIFFIFFGLLLGGILRQINKKTKIPYTPMLLVLGILFGYFREHLGVVGQSTQIIQKLHPHMILFIFIPVLIFQSAFNCDWHVFRKSMINILVLAGPGVLWGAILIAICFKVLLFYPDQQLTWYQALTLGCVLSATDPVAVVALLKQLGASVRFNTLVEGQSLLNDGTAMVFFMLFMDLAKGNTSSFAGVITNFVRVSIGGPLLGILFGIIISYWVKRIIRDSVLSINVTFVGAYLCFYVAQFTSVKVSGILSIVVLGLYMSAVGKRKIYPQSQHALHNVWSYIQYSCETLIFILTGIVVGVQMISQSTITWGDWVKMFAFWILMIIVRLIMVYTFLPILKACGYGLTKKQMIVLIYGGLRGALGLCLALMVRVDDQLPIRFRQITLFYMCGMAVLTIVVNGLTCGKLVNYIQMIHYPQIKDKLYRRCIKDILQNTQTRFKQIQHQPDFAFAKWKQVQNLAHIRELGTTKHEKRRTSIQQFQMRDSLVDIHKNQMNEEIRFRFTLYLNKVYWELYENGQVTEQAIKVLSGSCDIANDNTSERLNYFQILSKNFSIQTIKYYVLFKNTSIIGPYVMRMLVEKIYFMYEVASVFIEACDQTEHAFQKKFPLNSTQIYKFVLDQVKYNKQQAISFITQLQTNYSQIIQVVHTSRAATILLKNKKIQLQHLHEQGLLDVVQFEDLRKEIDRQIINIHFIEIKLEQIRFNQVLTQCPLFANLSGDQIVKIRMKSVEKIYEKGKKIISKGSSIDYVMIVVQGSVKQKYDNFYLIRSLGSIINPYDFTYHQTSKSDIKANSLTKIMQVKPDIIIQLLKTQNQFRKNWYKGLFIYSIRHKNCLKFFDADFSDKQLRRFIEGAQIVLMKQNDTQTVQHGAYVFEGEVSFQGNRYGKEQFISQQDCLKSITALNEVVLMKFTKFNGLQFKTHQRISVFNSVI